MPDWVKKEVKDLVMNLLEKDPHKRKTAQDIKRWLASNLDIIKKNLTEEDEMTIAISLLSPENKDLLSKALTKVAERPPLLYGDPPQDFGKVTFKKIVYPDGSVYVGQVRADRSIWSYLVSTDLSHGRGVYIQITGSPLIYQGWWLDDEQSY